MYNYKRCLFITESGGASIHNMAALGQAFSQEWSADMVEAVRAGAGEMVLNAVNRDGMMQGMDLELIREAEEVSVLLISLGGVGRLSDIKAGVDADPSAVAVGAFLCFMGHTGRCNHVSRILRA